jgi:hypothetical protein
MILAQLCLFELVVGVLAQLVERLVRNEKVRSSSLLGSTNHYLVFSCFSQFVSLTPNVARLRGIILAGEIG